MRRLLFVPLLSLTAIGALALPAHAKGPIESASGQVVITGPGLPGPIELKGTVRGFAEPGDGFMPTDARGQGDFTAFIVQSALLSDPGILEGPQAGWFVLPPGNLLAIGPAYQLRFDLAGEGWSRSMTRHLYPFAPERPLVFTPAESLAKTRGVRMNSKGLWWSAPPTLLGILRSHGLPLTAPPAAEPPPSTVQAPPGNPQGRVLLWAGLSFLALIIAGALAGRRRIRMA